MNFWESKIKYLCTKQGEMYQKCLKNCEKRPTAPERVKWWRRVILIQLSTTEEQMDSGSTAGMGKLDVQSRFGGQESIM